MAILHRFDHSPKTNRYFENWSCCVCEEEDPKIKGGTAIHGKEKRHILHVDCWISWLAQQRVCPICSAAVCPPENGQAVQPDKKKSSLASRITGWTLCSIPWMIGGLGALAASPYLLAVFAIADSLNGFVDLKMTGKEVKEKQTLLHRLQPILEDWERRPPTKEVEAWKTFYKNLKGELEQQLGKQKKMRSFHAMRMVVMGVLGWNFYRMSSGDNSKS